MQRRNEQGGSHVHDAGGCGTVVDIGSEIEFREGRGGGGGGGGKKKRHGLNIGCKVPMTGECRVTDVCEAMACGLRTC
jgi:hypothetical protein